MATEKNGTITRVNSELKALRDDLVGHRENPFLIRAVNSLVRLTNSPDDNATMDEAEAKAAAALPQCPHDVINRKTGKCIACGATVTE